MYSPTDAASANGSGNRLVASDWLLSEVITLASLLRKPSRNVAAVLNADADARDAVAFGVIQGHQIMAELPLAARTRCRAVVLY